MSFKNLIKYGISHMHSKNYLQQSIKGHFLEKLPQIDIFEEFSDTKDLSLLFYFYLRILLQICKPEEYEHTLNEHFFRKVLFSEDGFANLPLQCFFVSLFKDCQIKYHAFLNSIAQEIVEKYLLASKFTARNWEHFMIPEFDHFKKPISQSVFYSFFDNFFLIQLNEMPISKRRLVFSYLTVNEHFFDFSLESKQISFLLRKFDILDMDVELGRLDMMLDFIAKQAVDEKIMIEVPIIGLDSVYPAVMDPEALQAISEKLLIYKANIASLFSQMLEKMQIQLDEILNAEDDVFDKKYFYSINSLLENYMKVMIVFPEIDMDHAAWRSYILTLIENKLIFTLDLYVIIQLIDRVSGGKLSNPRFFGHFEQFCKCMSSFQNLESLDQNLTNILKIHSGHSIQNDFLLDREIQPVKTKSFDAQILPRQLLLNSGQMRQLPELGPEVNELLFAHEIQKTDFYYKLSFKCDFVNQCAGALDKLGIEYTRQFVDFPFVHDFKLKYNGKTVLLNVKNSAKMNIGESHILSFPERVKEFVVILENKESKNPVCLLWIDLEDFKRPDNQFRNYLLERISNSTL